MSPTTVDFETVREIASALPDVKESLGARGWAFRLRGQLLAFKAIHRSAEAGTLAARIDFADRTALIAADPNVFYVTPHYVDYPVILVRISRIKREALSEVLEKSWKFMMADPAAASRKKSAARKQVRKAPRAKSTRRGARR
jgi:hypothetical protein